VSRVSLDASGLTLDQMRVFAAVADEGSFSGAARRLGRVQSAVSHAIASLERQLEVSLFDRTARVPQLTDEGRVLLASARRVLAETEALARVADGLRGGQEPLVSICVDAIFPTAGLVELCRAFLRAFPTVELRVYTEVLSAVSARVRDGSCHLGVVGPAADTTGLERRHVGTVRMIPVAARAHPLAALRRRAIPSARLAEHVQIVLSERGPEGAARSPDQAVISPHTWRVVDLPTKHALLVAGLGWGNLPEHMARADLARGRLVRLRPEAWSEDEHLLPLSVVQRRGAAPGPATSWAIERLATVCAAHLAGGARATGDRRQRRRISAG
jgi:DNA-binding transcriptional LysR family regulator